MCPAQMIVHNAWTGFLTVGMSLAASAVSLIAYIPCILASRQHLSPPALKVSIYNFLPYLSCMTSLSSTAVAQTFPFHSAKRRRLYGLNTRFDRMLQEVSWTSQADSTKFSRSHYKRANSPSPSSTTNHDMPKTPTDSPNGLRYGSERIENCFVPTMDTGNQVYFIFYEQL